MKHVLTVIAAIVVTSVPRPTAQSAQTDTLWRSVIGDRVVTVVNHWQTTPLNGAYSVQISDDTGASSEVALPHARGAVSRCALGPRRVDGHGAPAVGRLSRAAMPGSIAARPG